MTHPSHFFSPSIDHFLFSPKGYFLIVILAIGYGIYLWRETSARKKTPRFQGVGLDEFVKNRIKQKSGLVGTPENKILRRGIGEDFGYVLSSVRMPVTKMEWVETPTDDKGRKQKGEQIKKTLELPESFIFEVVKNDPVHRYFLKHFDRSKFYVIVNVEQIHMESDKVIQLNKDIDFEYFGGTYIAGKEGHKYVKLLTEMKISEDVLEENANYLKKLTYYEHQQSAEIERLREVARISKEKFQDIRDEVVG